MQSAREQAQEWLRRGFVVVDTETTGTDPDADIVQFAAIDSTGRIVLHSLIKPSQPIDTEGGAFRVHGLDDRALEHAPPFVRVWPAIHAVLCNKLVIAYNSGFDSKMLDQCQRKYKGIAERPLFGHEWQCAMLLYSRHIRVSKWQKLQAACNDLGVKLDRAHDALYDCYAALEVIKAIAGNTGSGEGMATVDDVLKEFPGSTVGIVGGDRPL